MIRNGRVRLIVLMSVDSFSQTFKSDLPLADGLSEFCGAVGEVFYGLYSTAGCPKNSLLEKE